MANWVASKHATSGGMAAGRVFYSEFEGVFISLIFSHLT